jgi:putative ABC transport system permease protein
MVDVALKILLHDKLRFVITTSGVAFAVTLVLVQVGLFLGLLDNGSPRWSPRPKYTPRLMEW